MRTVMLRPASSATSRTAPISSGEAKMRPSGRVTWKDVPATSIDGAAAYALRGETERAAAELAEARRLDGGDLFSGIAHLKGFPGAWQGVPKIRALYEPTYFAGPRKAGMPEE
jgi:hypothetical protein